MVDWLFKLRTVRHLWLGGGDFSKSREMGCVFFKYSRIEGSKLSQSVVTVATLLLPF